MLLFDHQNKLMSCGEKDPYQSGCREHPLAQVANSMKIIFYVNKDALYPVLCVCVCV